MVIDNGLVMAKVAHTRLLPVKNSFQYKAYYLCFSLKEISRLSSWFLSLNRFNVLSFFSKDYLDGQGDLEGGVQKTLNQFNIHEADGNIVLMTMPRVLGYVFNPVSFWFCLDKDHHLRAVIAEINNTFGERHSYVVCHPDHRPILPEDPWFDVDKIFHISPFLEVRGSYAFRFLYGEKKLGVWIQYQDGEDKVLLTSVIGDRQSLRDLHILKAFFLCPLLTFKVVAMIHYQALKLFLKKVKFFNKPNPPITEISS